MAVSSVSWPGILLSVITLGLLGTGLSLRLNKSIFLGVPSRMIKNDNGEKEFDDASEAWIRLVIDVADGLGNEAIKLLKQNGTSGVKE